MDMTQQGTVLANGRRLLAQARREAWLVAALLSILALALGLRLYGLNWDRGYAYTPHPDERAILAKVEELSPPTLGELDLLLDADESPWNPRWFPYGSFPLYLLKGVQLVSSLGPGDGLADLRLAGRTISALADAATVMMVFVLGSRIYGRRVGLLASLLAALAVIHIQLSHFFAVDTLLALFAVVALYFMYRVAREGRLGDSVLAGAFVGLALATKVSLAPIFAAYVVAHLMYALSLSGGPSPPGRDFGDRWPLAVKGLALGAAATLAVLFIVQPYGFLDWSRFYNDVVEQSEMVRRIRDYPYTRQYIDTTPYLYHVRQLATWGLGWPLGIVAWAGLIYVSLRGMRLGHGAAYLVLGWGLPMAILVFSTSFLAIYVAAIVAVLALLATLPLRTADSRMDVLLLSWVAPSFLITGAFQVKFLRYLIPITPFLLLFGSRMLFALWDRVQAGKFRPDPRPWLVGGLVLLVGSTGFYALSYMSVYREPHTAVRASEWINRNVPAGSTILKEHWEEALPDLGDYRVRELPLYDEDGPRKLPMLADELAVADYLVFFSNRLYGTIPRLPERYPVSRDYYRLLFSGQLGYELVYFETSYPELLGIGFVDDTFGRPDVPEPQALSNLRPSSLALNLGFADESFTVYDHPKVLVFRNIGRHDSEAIRRTIQEALLFGVSSRVEADRQDIGRQDVGLMLSPEDAEAQQRGGTWSEIVRPNSWTNRLPVLAWLLAVQIAALLALPIAFTIFRPLSDRGYLFSKALGLLSVGLVVWLLASLHWMAFSRGSIGVGLLVLAAVSALVLAKTRHRFTAFVREQWQIILIGEAVFLLAFFSMAMLRMANPDLWHPFRGGEKPMDLAYLTAVLRSTYMPPYDPWYAGGYLNYYYWGQFIVATLIKATGIRPEVAFNLAVPMFFAMTASASFSVVYNLAEGTRRRLVASPSGDPMVSLPDDQRKAHPVVVDPSGAQAGPPEGRAEDRTLHWSAVMAGIGGALFVTVIGNLDGAIQVGQGVWRSLFRSLPFGQFDFYLSSRMMPSELEGITEFPFFTFLFADLHAHLMALPFGLLALGLALAVVMGAGHSAGRKPRWSVGEIARLAVLGVAVGSLRLLNAWDFPTYMMIAVAAIFLAEFYVHGGLGLAVLARAGLKSLLVFAVGFLVFLPFHLNYEVFFDSLDTTTATTALWRFLAISGLFIFIIGSFFINESRVWLVTTWRALRQWLTVIVQAVSESDEDASAQVRPRVGVESIVALVAGALFLGLVLTAVFSADRVGSTIPFIALLLALVLVVGLRWLGTSRPDSAPLTFVAVIVGVSLALVIGLDVFRVEGDVDRMNSVFKFYLQVWVLLALAAAYLLWRLAYGGRFSLVSFGWGKKVWLGALAVLILSAAVYPVMGTRDRLGVRFDGQVLPLTLDGTAYMRGTVYRGAEGDIDLEADFQGSRWLRENIEGSPIVLEGHTPSYRWGGRVSVYTGLPSIVGWQWHQEQQRWNYRWTVGQRIADVDTIYTTGNPLVALSLMRKYGVKYVYVGQLERLYYPGGGLEKFEHMVGKELEKVYQNHQVAIYRVRDGVARSQDAKGP